MDDTEQYDPFKEFNKTFEVAPPTVSEGGNGEAAPAKKRGRPKGFKLKVGGSGKSVAKARAQQESHPRKGRLKKTPQPVVTDPGALVTQIVEENKRLRGIITNLYEFLGKQI